MSLYFLNHFYVLNFFLMNSLQIKLYRPKKGLDLFKMVLNLHNSDMYHENVWSLIQRNIICETTS